MDTNEQLITTIADASSAIRSLMLLQIGAVVAAILATIAGYDRLQGAEYEYRELETRFGTEFSSSVAAIGNIWNYDINVIHDDTPDYEENVLVDASLALFINMMFLVQVNVLPDQGNEFTESLSDDLGKFFNQVSRLRVHLNNLRIAIQMGRDFADLSPTQLEAYADYIAFHEQLSKDGILSEQWTQACILSASLLYWVENDLWILDDLIGIRDMVLSPRGSKALRWAADQLVRNSDQPLDFVTMNQLFGSDYEESLVRDALEIGGVMRAFPTPREAESFGIYGFVVEQRASSEDVRQLAINLVETDMESLATAQRELKQRRFRRDELEQERAVYIPFMDIAIPRNQTWFLVFLNLAILTALIRQRNRAFQSARRLVENPDRWQLAVDTLPFGLIHRAKSPLLWLWDLHYSAFGLFGLMFATVFVYVYPQRQTASGLVALALCCIAIYTLTLVFWIRFRHPVDAHPLEKYGVFKLPSLDSEQ